jgi:phytoene dehydrogenase-like protein
VVVLESEHEVGGRVRTTVRDGFRLDHGFQVLFTAYPTLRRELDLGALGLRTFAPAARLCDGTGAHALIGDALADLSLLWPTLRAGELAVSDKLRLLALRATARATAFDDCFAPQFDGVATRAFLQHRGFSSRAIERFFAPFYGGILLDRTLNTAASVLLYTFKMLAEGRTVVPAEGMGAMTQQLVNGLAPGTVRTHTRVTQLRVHGDGVQGVTLGGGEQIDASAVVLATDAVSLASLADTAGLGSELSPIHGALGCTTLYLRSRTELLPGTALWLNGSTDATVSHAITLSNVAPSYAPTGWHLTAATMVGGNATLGDSELLARVLSDLGRMRGQPLGPDAEHLATWRVPFSQYPQLPGCTGRRLDASTPIRGLVLASELLHTSSLEGAARGGLAASQAVLALR